MRLQFSSEKLYGRDEELSKLQQAYQEVRVQQQSRLILLEGYSGNGKTSLVTHFGASLPKLLQQQVGEKYPMNDSSASSCSRTATSATRTTMSDSSNRGSSSSSTNHHHKRRARLFIKGKFDEQNQKPYAAFVQAFGEMIASIIRNRRHETERIEAIRQAVGANNTREPPHSTPKEDAISELIPNLRELLGTPDTTTTTTNVVTNKHTIDSTSNREDPLLVRNTSSSRLLHRGATSTRMLEQMNQFRFRFKSFVRAVCGTSPGQEQHQPIVLFLDDLQWADSSSLELLKTIVSDTTSHNLLIIAAYRGHQVGENHPLRVTISQLKNEDYFRGLSEIELTDLNEKDLNQFLADSLSLAPEKTLSLSDVVMRKTHGNIFHSKEFLKHLKSRQLIRYDMTFYQWTWDVQEILGATDISENVVDLVASRIRQLPDNVVAILKIASCLWFSFDVNVLEYIVVNAQEKLKQGQQLTLQLSRHENKPFRSEIPVGVEQQSEVMKGVLVATETGLIDQIGTNGTAFKFSHDRIREATYCLIQEGEERDNMHTVIGELLWCLFHSDKNQQWMLFSAVDQLNKVSGCLNLPNLRVELAEVNLEAAECACSVSAFLPAIDYLKSGIRLLGEAAWEKHYDLCLALHSRLASLESSTAHSEESDKLIQETLQRARTFDDKLPVYITLVESLGVQGRLNESLDLAYEVLAGLGEAFPKKKSGRSFERKVRNDTEETRLLLSNHSDATILALPRLEDKTKQSALKILNLMVDPTFHTGQMLQLFQIINRMVRISIVFGLGDTTGVAFALYGFSLKTADGSRRQNYRYGRLALMLQEQLNTREWDCRVLVYVYVLLNHWQEPLQKSLNPLLAAHSVGMETGDIDYAFQSAGAFLTLYWYSGNDLKSGVSEMRKFCAQMKEYKQEKVLSIYLPLYQCMLNMTGSCQDAVLLAGEAISQEEFEEKQFSNSTIMSYQMQLAYYFGDMKLAEKLSINLQEVSKSFNAHYLFVARLFFFGLISLRIAFDVSGRKRRRNISIARRMINEMEQWTSHGGLNCLHKLLILKAELQAFDFLHGQRRCFARKTVDAETVRSAFDAAIATSIRSGFCNDAALACERASAFCERCNEDTFYVQTYHSQALGYYNQWGARAKVEHMTLSESKSMTFELLPNLAESRRHGFRDTALTDHERVRLHHDSISSHRGPKELASSVLRSSTGGGLDVMS